MSRIINSKIEKQTIYDIYRACRLCGAGGGYKMPIIQNIIDLEGVDIELRQKISECVQIEVHTNDKMPPLICELCVDKVNDFYEFLEMCRQTNKRTRLRLGLPPQTSPREEPDSEDCILGVTEPVYINNDNKSSKHKKNTRSKESDTDKKKMKSPVVKMKSSQRKPEVKHQSKPLPKPILRKEIKTEESSSLLTSRTVKRQRETEPSKQVVPAKKVKISIKPVQKPSPSPATFPCLICGNNLRFKALAALISHLRWTHTASYTSDKLACNACGEWFVTQDEANAHHKRHQARNRPYHCARCVTDFKQRHAYDEHIEKNQCVPWTQNPDVRCETCWKHFPTNNLRKKHKCPGRGNRPGGTCGKCGRSYSTQKYMRKHERFCSDKMKEPVVDPGVLDTLKPVQVRVARCDSLLSKMEQEHYDVSSVTQEFGLDKNYVYPYISSVDSVRIKTEPPDDLDAMVNIKQEIKDEFFCEEEFIHWDSSESSEDDNDSDVCNKNEYLTPNLVANPFAKKKKVDTLSVLSIKTIFSQKLLGKVPRKRRKLKMEKNTEFDSTMNNFNNSNMTNDINNIINNLENNDSGIGNNDFDSLFKNESAASIKNHATGNLKDKRGNDMSELDTKLSDFSKIEDQGSPQIDYIDTLLQNSGIETEDNEESQETVDNNCDDHKTNEEINEYHQKRESILQSAKNDCKKKSIEDDALTKIDNFLSGVQTNNNSDNSQDTVVSDDNTEIDAIDALLQNNSEKSIQQNENAIQNCKSDAIDDLLQVHDKDCAESDEKSSQNDEVTDAIQQNEIVIRNGKSVIDNSLREHSKDCTENDEKSDQNDDVADRNAEKITLDKYQSTNNAVEESFEKIENPQSILQKDSPEKTQLDVSHSSINNSKYETNNGISDNSYNLDEREKVKSSFSVEGLKNNQITSEGDKIDKCLAESDSLESSSNTKDASTNDSVLESDETWKINGESIGGLEDVSDTEMEDERSVEVIGANLVDNLKNDEVKIHDSGIEKGKITLEDLLPQNKSMDLDNISDEEFNFDA